MIKLWRQTHWHRLRWRRLSPSHRQAKNEGRIAGGAANFSSLFRGPCLGLHI